MIRLRTASALAAGALAAASITGAALAAAIDDGPARTAVSIASSTGPDGALLDDSPGPDDSTGSDGALPDDNPSPDDSPGPGGALPDDNPSRDDSPGPDVSPTADEGFGPDDTAPGGASATVSPTVGAETARLIALRTVGGGRVTSIEHETEHGRPVYDVRVVLGGVRHDLRVDRLTGTVLRHRVDGEGATSSRGSDDDASHHRGRGSDDANRGRRGKGRGSDD